MAGEPKMKIYVDQYSPDHDEMIEHNPVLGVCSSERSAIVWFRRVAEIPKDVRVIVKRATYYSDDRARYEFIYGRSKTLAGILRVTRPTREKHL